MPAAIATTFLSAPQSSTPTRSSDVYNRNAGVENRYWISSGKAPSSPATTAADGSPRATPSASPADNAYRAGTMGMVDAGTYYWHFVDAVWIVIFVVVYLL